MTHAPTLSGLHLLAACPGSASLPHQRREGTRGAPIGHAIHELLQWEIEADATEPADVLAAKHELSPDDAGRLAFLAEHLRLPVPPGALAEVALGLFPDMSVRRIGGGAGSYPDVGQVLSGTIDAMWSEPEPLVWRTDFYSIEEPNVLACPPGSTLWVPDWKTGDEDHVPPIARNWQLRAGALLAARWTGATRVIPAICFINAGECAAALREGRAYEGRWEVGAPLDAAALDAIEVELRAVLSAARGESDEALVLDVQGASVGAGQGIEHLPILHQGGQGGRAPPLILGPHCEHCPARAHCPEFGAAARQLVEQSYLSPQSPVLMLPHERALLAALLPALRATLDRAEDALRAGGPVELADGRVYGPALEPVTSYRTAPTFDALAAIVGEERANDAAVYTTSSIKQALADAGALRGAFGRLRAEIEAAGGVVPAAREVWRKRWPAVLAEKVEDERDQDSGQRRADDASGPGAVCGGENPHVGTVAIGDGGGASADSVGALDVVAVRRASDHHVASADPDGDRDSGGRVARATCPDCGTPGIAVNRSGTLRKHQLPGTALRCRPGLKVEATVLAGPVPRPLGQPSPAPPAPPIPEPAPVAQLSLAGA